VGIPDGHHSRKGGRAMKRFLLNTLVVMQIVAAMHMIGFGLANETILFLWAAFLSMACGFGGLVLTKTV
jgi:hypothetical protein